MKNEDTLISMLISETYKEEGDTTAPVVDLNNYFERKRNEAEHISMTDYLSHNDINHMTLVLNIKSQCYRVIIANQVVDFPSNWSVFGTVSSSDLVYINEECDHDYLLDIFSELTGENCNLALVNDDQCLEMVLLKKSDSKKHIEWVKEYLDKKANKEIEKRAA